MDTLANGTQSLQLSLTCRTSSLPMVVYIAVNQLSSVHAHEASHVTFRFCLGMSPYGIDNVVEVSAVMVDSLYSETRGVR